MTARTLLALVPVGLAAAVAAAGPPAADRPAAKLAPADGVGGFALLAPGTPLARGSAPRTRPRAEAFVPGQLPAGLPFARVPKEFTQADSAPFPDRMDVVFYAKPRPVRVQIAVRTGGKPLAKRWEDHLRKLFAAFDRDGDGFLNRYEIDHIFPLDGMRQMFNGGQYYRAGGAQPTLEALDLDGDNRVSFAEFAHYYRDAVTDMIRARAVPGQAGGDDTVTRELFNHLDRDGDGKLSEAELRSAEKILLALDADEDECVSTAELLTNPARRREVRAAVTTAMAARQQPAPTPPPQEVAVYQTGVPGSVVQQIIKHYDKNGDYALTREEVGLDADTFARLDKNGDGKLSATELDGWRSMPPDVVVVLELGDSPLACKASASPPVGRSWPAGLTVRQTEQSRLVLRIGSQTMEFGANTPPEATRRQVNQQMAAGVFPQGSKVVEEKDLVGPQNQFLRVIFDDADFNGDGKLTREEFERYFALQRGTAELGLSLTYAVRTPNLFQMLDDNMDGKLGVRELRTAWDRLIVLEPAGSTAVTKAILQPSVTLRLTPAAFAVYDPSAFANPFNPSSRGPSAGRGPLWFRKMDRNGDGDVSRGEFLGAEADFAALDTDKDGLISLEEAEAYEKKVRPPKADAKKPKEVKKK